MIELDYGEDRFGVLATKTCMEFEGKNVKLSVFCWARKIILKLKNCDSQQFFYSESQCFNLQLIYFAGVLKIVKIPLTIYIMRLGLKCDTPYKFYSKNHQTYPYLCLVVFKEPNILNLPWEV